MAIADLIEKGKAAFNGNAEDEAIDVPDDVSGITDEEPDDLLPPDPRPNRKGGPTKVRKATATAAQKRQAKDGTETLILMLGGAWSIRDAHCGGAMVDAADPVSKALVPILARHPTWMAKFDDSGEFLEWLKLAAALRPVAAAIWGHHVSRSVRTEEEADAVDYSAYGAPAFA